MFAKTETTRYDVAEYLRTPEEIAAYLEACFEEADSDAAFITKALGDVARTKGMSQLRELAEPTIPSDDRANRLVRLLQSWIDEAMQTNSGKRLTTSFALWMKIDSPAASSFQRN